MTWGLPIALVVAATGLIGCGGANDATEPGASTDSIVVTFEVDDERFKALLTDPADIDIARHLLAGDDVPSIPNGRVIRQTGVNTGYSWSMDPNDIQFAVTTIEVCDGLPSEEEAGAISGDRYCPWAAVVVAIEPPP
jgi:hypothetical protein